MVESKKRDLLADEILYEREDETKGRMTEAVTLIDGCYFDYIERYIRNPLEFKESCAQVTEPGADFVRPEDVKELLLGK